VVLVGLAMVPACEDPDGPDSGLFNLTMVVSPADSGTTVPAVGTHKYEPGTVVNIQAAPTGDYEFVNWSASPAVTFAQGASMPVNSFTMPTSSVVLTANSVRWVPQSVTLVDIYNLASNNPTCSQEWSDVRGTIETALDNVDDTHRYGQIVQGRPYRCAPFSDYTADNIVLPEEYQVIRARVLNDPTHPNNGHEWLYIRVTICGEDVWIPIECTPPDDGGDQKRAADGTMREEQNQCPRIAYEDRQAETDFDPTYFGAVEIRQP